MNISASIIKKLDLTLRYGERQLEAASSDVLLIKRWRPISTEAVSDYWVCESSNTCLPQRKISIQWIFLWCILHTYLCTSIVMSPYQIHKNKNVVLSKKSINWGHITWNKRGSTIYSYRIQTYTVWHLNLTFCLLISLC